MVGGPFSNFTLVGLSSALRSLGCLTATSKTHEKTRRGEDKTMDRVYFWCVGGWPTDLVLALISSLLFLGTQNEQGDTDVLWLGFFFFFFFLTFTAALLDYGQRDQVVSFMMNQERTGPGLVEKWTSLCVIASVV